MRFRNTSFEQRAGRCLCFKAFICGNVSDPRTSRQRSGRTVAICGMRGARDTHQGTQQRGLWFAERTHMLPARNAVRVCTCLAREVAAAPKKDQPAGRALVPAEDRLLCCAAIATARLVYSLALYDAAYFRVPAVIQQAFGVSLTSGVITAQLAVA